MELSMPDPTTLGALSSDLAANVARTAPALLSVHSHRARSSGFAWKPDLVVTADEALAEEGEIVLALADGTTRSATIAGRDHTTDIALLRVQGASLPPATLATEAPALGALAVIVAADRGTPAAALAMVSKSAGPWRSLRGGAIDARIELDARLHHAQEGGLVLDATGQAIGMAVRGPRRTLVIPTATIARVASRLESHGRIARGYLGAGLQPVRIDNGTGAMVMNVDSTGPAAAAGLRQGDVITALNGQIFQGMRRLLHDLGPDSVGAVVEIAALRGGEPIRLALTIGERPA
jgi:S1-C subfamily serine protease